MDVAYSGPDAPWPDGPGEGPDAPGTRGGPPPPPVPSSSGRDGKRDDASGPTVGELSGVRPGEGERGRRRRDRPRLAFTPMHALCAILVLVTALCASLTMLVRQSVQLDVLQRVSAAHASAGGGSDGSAGAGASDDADDGTGDGADAAGEGTGTDAGTGQDAAPSQSQSQPPPATGAGAGPLDLNTADQAALDTLPGVGPAIAGRILAHRASIGRFSSVDQLLDVSGIGPKTLARIRDLVTVR